MSLGGNTPQETCNGLSIDFSRYSKGFNEHKAYRIQQNKKNICKPKIIFQNIKVTS